jgi:zinc protease
VTTYLVAERLTSISLNPTSAAAKASTKLGAVGPTADFSEMVLPNGARLLLQPDRRIPNLHLRFLLQGGPLIEPADKRGITALFATMLTKDTRRRTAAQVANLIESVGGSLYPFSGNNSMGLAVEVLPTDADRALAILQEAILEPAFVASTLVLERDAQLAALRQDADDVVTLARKRLRKLYFKDHPLALDAQGDEAGVSSITARDLEKFHRQTVVGSNVVLAVAGDFDVRRFVPKLKAFLAKLPRRAFQRPDLRFPGAGAADLIEAQPREQAVVLQAFPGPAVTAPDYFVGEVADELFSGMASRLFERVREEKGLAYFVRSARISGMETAMFYFFAGTQPGRENDVLAEIDAEIARVQAGGVEAVELARCQARLKAGHRQALQTNSARAMQAGLSVMQGLPANDWRNYDTRIDAVSLGDLKQFASRYLTRAQRTQLIVRP